MRGGKISRNTASLGGGVMGIRTMTGGEISNNIAGIGGGVYVSGTFTMYDGEISGNTSSSEGGGVNVASYGTFTMHDGVISGNISSSTYSTEGGGGVYVHYNGTFTMHDGAISDNTSSSNGGGVYISSGTFTITDGTVYGSNADSTLANTASGNGAALYVIGGTAKYSDDTDILPHTDSQSTYTNNTITGTPVLRTPGFVREVVFTGQTEVVNLDNLSRNIVYLVKVNTSGLVVNAVDTGIVHAPPASLQNTGESSLPLGEELPRMGHPAADEFSANPPPIVEEPPRRQRAVFVPPAVGDTRYFWVETYWNSRIFEQRQATLLATGTHGNIWVMNENTASGTSANKITSTQAQTLAEKFDLIYPIETNIIGYEYGGGPGGDGGKDGDPKVQLLFYDIVGGNVGGYFWGKDFYDDTQLSTGWKSNLAEIFYIQARMAIGSPDYTYSCLAHEFQHMINFNQKTVKQGVSSASWYNEMLSLMVEDVIAPLIGVAPTNSSHAISERMPTALANYYLEGITEWSTLSSTSYAKGFAFGAYLMRNYGGAELLQRILANNTTNIASVTSALNQFQSGLTFEQALKRYGEAMIFSGSSMPENVLTYDKTVTKTINGTAYTVYGFDVWNDHIMGPVVNYFRGPTILDLSTREMRPHSISIHSSDEWRGSGNFSITLERPSDPNVVLYLMVK